ncbi:hypothetical protein Nepgr_018013 [Nepenthes gracilis]|uniref:Uncharacterized protein n=1 Tax=Nepenthes gracilis TaxID=150966 RepID=A0AAD3STC7_NEPGR|nr:hypothetical protein Nepgr_018013 [Nepenthes gracilis]
MILKLVAVLIVPVVLAFAAPKVCVRLGCGFLLFLPRASLLVDELTPGTAEGGRCWILDMDSTAGDVATVQPGSGLEALNLVKARMLPVGWCGDAPGSIRYATWLDFEASNYSWLPGNLICHGASWCDVIGSYLVVVCWTAAGICCGGCTMLCVVISDAISR